jgi:hypothetical protein
LPSLVKASDGFVFCRDNHERTVGQVFNIPGQPLAGTRRRQGVVVELPEDLILVDGDKIKTSQLRAFLGFVKEDVVANTYENAVPVTVAGAHYLDRRDESVKLILATEFCTAPGGDQQADDWPCQQAHGGTGLEARRGSGAVC